MYDRRKNRAWCSRTLFDKELDGDFNEKFDEEFDKGLDREVDKELDECFKKKFDVEFEEEHVRGKIPVVISSTKVDICIDAKIRLDYPAIEIIDCDEIVVLKGCELFDSNNKEYGKLFLDGFIRKKIKYAAVDTSCKKKVKGNIRFIIVNIPFQCSAKADYRILPILKQRGGCISCRLFQPEEIFRKRGGASQCENNGNNIYYELSEVAIFGKELTPKLSLLSKMDSRQGKAFKSDSRNHTTTKKTKGTEVFDIINEQISFSITVSILQRQAVCIP